MALIIETGAVIANADSFLSLADARSLAEAYGRSLPAEDTAAEVILRQGYRYLLTQESQLQGSRVSAEQTGIYPRTGVYSNCFPLPSAFIPIDVKLAQLNASDSINSGTETNGTNDGTKLSGFNVDGVYSETYHDGSSKRLTASIQGVVESLYPLTKAGFAASPCGGGAGGLSRESMGFLG